MPSPHVGEGEAWAKVGSGLFAQCHSEHLWLSRGGDPWFLDARPAHSPMMPEMVVRTLLEEGLLGGCQVGRLMARTKGRLWGAEVTQEPVWHVHRRLSLNR